MKKRFALAALLAAALALPALAQFPARSVTLVVPFPPGGGTDTGSRLLALKLAKIWGQPVVVENKPGAAGMLGADLVSKAKPDGYTILMGNIGTQSINPSLYATMPYKAEGAFEPVSLVAMLPMVMLTNPNVPAKSATEAIALAKSKPGKLTYSSSGPGSSMHLTGALFESEARVDMLHVPYKGGGPAITDLIAGHVDFSFATILESSGHIKAGRLRAVGVTSDKRSPALPEVPTLSETGVAGFNTGSWIGVLAPAGTPKDVVDKIARDIREAVTSPEVRDPLIAQGATPVGSTPAEFATLIESDRKRYGQIIRERKIVAQ